MNPQRVQRILADPDGQALAAFIAETWREIGYREAERDMARRWRAAAASVQDVLRRPTYAELQRRRSEAA